MDVKPSNISKIKSTVLGLILMGFGAYLLHENITTDYWILGSVFTSGFFLFFTGDGWINKLQDFIFGFLNKKNNQN